MKKKRYILLSLVCVIVLFGCSGNFSSNPPASQPNGSTISPSIPIELEEEDTQSESSLIPTVNIQVGSNNFTVILYDNDSARELLKRLPMILNMEELNGNEKYYFLSNTLLTNPESPRQIKTGDLMLFGSDCLVLFYDSFATSYSYTRLGYIEDVTGLADVLGADSVEVTFNLKEITKN